MPVCVISNGPDDVNALSLTASSTCLATTPGIDFKRVSEIVNVNNEGAASMI